MESQSVFSTLMSQLLLMYSGGRLLVLFMRRLFVQLSGNSQRGQTFVIQVLMEKRHFYSGMEGTQEVFLQMSVPSAVRSGPV